ncbi:hypothetical protein [Sphingobacterium kitahiroshimense]|uniref:Uncharacterized protein n=1 Tax=Sphingobacterium kitahiroshimense TaxID=470446 RepID=A0ABV0C0Z8_9SPHI
MKTNNLTSSLIILFIFISFTSLSQVKTLPNELKQKIRLSYIADKILNKSINIESIGSSEKNKMNSFGLFSKKPKLKDVKEPIATDSLKLPDWIANKKYVTENVDAIKYEPSLLLGSLVKVYNDGSFDIYSSTWNISDPKSKHELNQLLKPSNFYEQTYDNKTRFNSDFLVGGISINTDEMVKITYTETNYVNLKKYNETKLKELRTYITSIKGAELKDWAIIRGVVILDCTNSKSTKMEADANATASWVSAKGSFFQQTGSTNNFRLVSIDLENLFLEP